MFICEKNEMELSVLNKKSQSEGLLRKEEIYDCVDLSEMVPDLQIKFVVNWIGQDTLPSCGLMQHYTILEISEGKLYVKISFCYRYELCIKQHT